MTHNIENPHSHDLPEDAQDPLLGMMKRMETIFKGTTEGIDKLKELHDKGPEAKEEFELFLDDLVYEALAENEEFLNNAAQMRSGKLSNEEQVVLKAKQNEIFNHYKTEVVKLAELPDDAAHDDFEISRKKITQLLEANHVSAPKDGLESILNTLGMIQTDQDGNEIFTYPEALFPASTDKKWEIYLESVRNHLRKERGVSAGTLDKHEVEDADKIRRYAHNSVTRDIHEILGLDQLPTDRWDFESTRKFVAKMRDQKFPTVETAEKERTTNDILDALHVVKALTTRLSDLHK